MCCFSQPVELVADTNIFARSSNGRQFLVYSMSYAAPTELAMVLPLPVPPTSSEDAVRFINLKSYPTFFDDMRRGFRPRMLFYRYVGAAAESIDAPKLHVHDVGDFEASFVPRIADFDRLDERFRMSPDVWDRLPAYRDYGFAVFKLKASATRGFAGVRRKRFGGSVRKPRRVHPMAFTFPRRNPELLYFPTLHVHDREVHPDAIFDHMLYCQPGVGMDDYLQAWERSDRPASGFMTIANAEGVVDPDDYCWRRPLEGRLGNEDTMVGRGGSIPSFVKSKEEIASEAERAKSRVLAPSMDPGKPRHSQFFHLTCPFCGHREEVGLWFPYKVCSGCQKGIQIVRQSDVSQ